MQNWVLTLSSAVLLTAAYGDEAPRAPATRIEVVIDRMHGVDIPDPYRWLEDQNSPQTRAWIDAQNAYTRAILDAIPGRDRLRAQLESLYRRESLGPPIARNGRYFYMRTTPERNQPMIAMREGFDGHEHVLVDPLQFSPDGSVSARIMDVSRDGLLLAYAKRKGGQDEAEVLILNVDTGKPFGESLPQGVYYTMFLLPDKSGYLYSRRTAEGTRLVEHRFGSPVSADRVIFGDGIPDEKITWASFSEDGRFVAAFVSDGAGSDAVAQVYFLDRAAGGGKFVPLITDVEASFSGSFGGHTLFLRTTWNAPNGRLLAVDLEHPARENWREVIPESADTVLGYVTPVGHKLAVSFTKNVITRLAIFDQSGKWIRDIALPTLGSGYFARGARWDSNEVFYGFSSFAQPVSVYRYDVGTAKQSLWFKMTVPIDTDSIRTTQVWYQSKDGTRVPMFIVLKKGTKPDGNRPVLLTAYGGYGSSSSPYFDRVAAMIATKGGIFALANIRGGGEFGEQWHRNGMLDKKQNSFDDFIAAAEWLIASKYTSPARLAIEGGSNGGLLVGAAAVQRPDLFRAVLCHVPHLDMLRFHKFLKAAPWVREYGDPDVAADFEYLRKYSPYHNVKDGTKYPAVLFTTGDNDTRVAPLHARKMTARMQAATSSGLPIMLRYDLMAGHSGPGSLVNLLDQQTDEMAFLYLHLGLTP